MNATAQFWNKIAVKYSKQAIADEASYQKKLQITQEYFSPQMEILEIGCGTGSTAIVHAPFVKHIRAIDISSTMIEIAQQKALDANIHNVTFEQATVDECAVEEASQDMVMAHSILHLVDNRQALIKRIFTMLKPGGMFVSSTICLAEGFSFLKPIMPIGRLFGFMPPTVQFFTQAQLEKEISDAGFEIVYDWKPGKRKAVFIVAKRPN